MIERELKRIYRHKRIRKRIAGSGDQPRVCVHRSLKNFSVQVIDDSTGKILFGLSTSAKTLRSKIKDGGNVEGAAQLGEIFAAEAKKKGITRVCFDRGGYLFHGRVKAFADAARKGGMEF